MPAELPSRSVKHTAEQSRADLDPKSPSVRGVTPPQSNNRYSAYTKLLIEHRQNGVLLLTADFLDGREGLNALLRKRAPDFRGNKQ